MRAQHAPAVEEPRAARDAWSICSGNPTRLSHQLMHKQKGPIRKISVAFPVIGETEKRYVADCMETSWISSIGKYLSRFEEAFAEFCEVKHAITTNNGTTAIHLALVALGIGPGDEVIVPTLTFV